MKFPTPDNKPVNSTPKFPEAPPSSGMNLHDWATFASAFLLLLVIVVGLVLFVAIDGKLSKLEEQQSLVASQIEELQRLSSQSQADSSKNLSQQVTQVANASKFLKQHNDDLATSIAGLKGEISAMERKLADLLNKIDARLAEQPAPKPEPKQGPKPPGAENPATLGPEQAGPPPPSQPPSQRPPSDASKLQDL